MGTFFPAEWTAGFAAVPCFLCYFWLVWLAVPAVSVGAGLGAWGGLFWIPHNPRGTQASPGDPGWGDTLAALARADGCSLQNLSWTQPETT